MRGGRGPGRWRTKGPGRPPASSVAHPVPAGVAGPGRNESRRRSGIATTLGCRLPFPKRTGHRPKELPGISPARGALASSPSPPLLPQGACFSMWYFSCLEIENALPSPDKEAHGWG